VPLPNATKFVLAPVTETALSATTSELVRTTVNPVNPTTVGRDPTIVMLLSFTTTFDDTRTVVAPPIESPCVDGPSVAVEYVTAMFTELPLMRIRPLPDTVARVANRSPA